jgi:hypothetical protein
MGPSSVLMNSQPQSNGSFTQTDCWWPAHGALHSIMLSQRLYLHHVTRQQDASSWAKFLAPAFLSKFSGSSRLRLESSHARRPAPCCSSKPPKALPPSTFSGEFWLSRPSWRRAGVNTLRCLVGCTLGDFSAMWYLQAFHPDMQMGIVMAVSSNYMRFLR